MKYNKLIRDKIPDIILQKGGTPVTHIANEEEYYSKLKEKLLEETQEFLKDNNTDELADVLEVVYAIRDFKNISEIDLETLRKKKALERGAFKQKIILDES